MSKLDEYLRQVNPYYHSYKQMWDIEKEEEEKANNQGIKPPSISLCFKSFKQSDNRRYNIPSASEIAAVFRDEDGGPPFEREFVVHSKPNPQSLNNIQKLNILSPHIDPMVYPLLFPCGEPGWSTHLEHEEEFRYCFIKKYLSKVKISFFTRNHIP